jgi:hypothetical protein
MPDGTSIIYSPGWYGDIPLCPKGEVTVDLYNDEEGWGIAHTEDVFILQVKEVEILETEYALKLISSAEDGEGVFFGEKLNLRLRGDYHKGDECIYKHIICQEGICKDCQVSADHVASLGKFFADSAFGVN